MFSSSIAAFYLVVLFAAGISPGGSSTAAKLQSPAITAVQIPMKSIEACEKQALLMRVTVDARLAPFPAKKPTVPLYVLGAYCLSSDGTEGSAMKKNEKSVLGARFERFPAVLKQGTEIRGAMSKPIK